MDNNGKQIRILPVNQAGEILTKLRIMFGAKAQIQENDVRLEHVLSATAPSRLFNMQGDGQNQRHLETYINRNDLVVLYELKVALNKVITALNGNNGNSPDFTYPDLNEFPLAGVAPAQSEAACLEAVYSGQISIKANTYEILNKLILRRFRVVPQTQQSATTQAQLDERGFVPFHQPYILSGRDNNELQFTAASGADVTNIGGGAGEQNILALHFKSFTVRNGAQPLTNSEMAEFAQYTKAMKENTSFGALV